MSITIKLSIEDDSLVPPDGGSPRVWAIQHRITDAAIKVTPLLWAWLFATIGEMRDKVLKEFENDNGGEGHGET